MKRTVLHIFLIVSLFSAVGCKKAYFPSDDPFTILLEKIQPNACWVDIVPETNDFNYYLSAIPADIMKQFATDAEFIKWNDESLKEMYKQGYEEYGTFDELFLTKGAYYDMLFPLDPETDYYVFAIPYTDGNEPYQVMTAVPMRTPPIVPADIKLLDVSIFGSVITVTTSNDTDTYFWDYEYKNIVNDMYPTPDLYLYSTIWLYTQYDMIDALISKGTTDSKDMADFYEYLEPGDVFYLVFVGFDNGVTTPYIVYEVVYAGEGKQGSAYRITNGFNDIDNDNVINNPNFNNNRIFINQINNR
ncbi:MAG: hypothetical protein J6Z27_04175 [Bacteroidales bacterium]|nr:hypothetical protein [Bacteroidales bacterium]